MTGAQNAWNVGGCAKTMKTSPENDDKGNKDKRNVREDMRDNIIIDLINYIEARFELIDVEDEKIEEKRNCECEEVSIQSPVPI